MERRNRDWTLVDGMTAGLGGPKTAAFFARCEGLIPWSKLAGSIGDVYEDAPGKGGRPHWPVEMMIKCLLLQKWFALSDPQLEEILQDRLSFRRFVGLGLEDATPDETTFVVFRRRLREAGHERTLFEKTTRILESRGLVVERGTLVDAMIVEAPRGRTRADGGSTRDPEAAYTKKAGQIRHGFKAHIATDRRGLIRTYEVTAANVHELTVMERLIRREKKAVYADSAYMDQRWAERLRRRGVHCGIIKRRGRGQAALSEGVRRFNRLCARVRAIVEHPFAWMRNMGYRVTRYRGQERNEMDFGLMAAAYNWKRAMSLAP